MESQLRRFLVVFLAVWTICNIGLSISLFQSNQLNDVKQRDLNDIQSKGIQEIDPTVNSHLRPSNVDKRNQVRNLNLKEHYDVCIIGAGLSGTVFADRSVSLLKKSVLLLEEREHLGGNCYDYKDKESGILMNKYGAHLFHTNDEKVFKYITMHKNAPKWVRWDHKVIGKVSGRLVPIPVNIETVNVLLNQSIQNTQEMNAWLRKVQQPCFGECQNAEEMAVSRVGKELFELIFRDYTLKQWARQPKELDPLVTARIPVRSDFDSRYFGDRYQVLPSQGYTKFFEALLLNREGLQVETGINYFTVKDRLKGRCDQTIFTGPIDKYFDDIGLESLEYRSINFKKEIFYDKGYFQPNSVVNYPSSKEEYTRIVEYKHFLHQTSPHTVIVREFPSDSGDPYYPIPNPRNLQLYEKYKLLASKEEEENNVYFVGRLANYKYFNMDAAIANALDLFYKINNKPNMGDLHPFYS